MDYTTTFNDTVQDDLTDSFDFSLNISCSFESSMLVMKNGSYSTIGIMARVLCAQFPTRPNCELQPQGRLYTVPKLNVWNFKY